MIERRPAYGGTAEAERLRAIVEQAEVTPPDTDDAILEALAYLDEVLES